MVPETRVKGGLFAWIRNTPFYTFVLAWLGAIFLFTIIYWILSAALPGLQVLGNAVAFNAAGLLDSLYVSFLAATVFGIVNVTSTTMIINIFLYMQLVFSGLVILILIDKLLQKYLFPHYHIHHTQDKKINTMMMTMSIFRSDIDRIRVEFKSKTKHHLDIKEIEATIDGLYVTFLDIDKMFSSRNEHRHHITDHQHLMVITSIEDSLHKLSRFIDFLEEHKISWKDKSVEFWVRYILETADKITLHFEDAKLKNPKLIIALENIKEWTQTIEKKI